MFYYCRIGSSFYKQLDPGSMTVLDRSGFEAWLDISMGSQIKTFLHAGGHFADLIAYFRRAYDLSYQKILTTSLCTHIDTDHVTDDINELVSKAHFTHLADSN